MPKPSRASKSYELKKQKGIEFDADLLWDVFMRPLSPVPTPRPRILEAVVGHMCHDSPVRKLLMARLLELESTEDEDDA